MARPAVLEAQLRSLSHGGDVERVAREAGIAADQILDFSANVNPAGLPACALERLERDLRDPRVLTRYPDSEASELRCALSRRLEIAVDRVVVGAGADALIHAAVRALAPRRCLILVPAFSEYERACAAYGCEVHRVPGASAPDVGPGDLVVLNNPHNPTGACLDRSAMLERISAIRAAGAAVLADEAFIDYVPEAAITGAALEDEGLIAVRSLTKFYGCPGLRVGYAVAGPNAVRALSAQLASWPVTTLALNVLTAALSDDEYVRLTLERNQQARAHLVRALEDLGFRVYPPSANFVFCEAPGNALEIRRRLIQHHRILVRECDSFAGLEPGRYLRIAVRRDDENARLVEALAAVLGERTCRQRR